MGAKTALKKKTFFEFTKFSKVYENFEERKIRSHDKISEWPPAPE